MKRSLAMLLALMLLIPAALAEEIWSPREAPPVHADMGSVLAMGELMYEGEVNKGWYPKDIAFLQHAAMDDYIILNYVCDDPNHGGWKVLTVNAKTAANTGKVEINADSATPTKERTLIYTVQELLDLAGAASGAELTQFFVGVWNGGRIVSAYFLGGAAAESYRALGEGIIHTYTGALSNENAIPEAKAVYAYLQEMWGQGCLTGQMESTWMGTPDYEMNFIREHTGKLPAIRGLDFMHNDFQGVVDRSIAWWKKGGIPHICWHTGSDFASGYNESKDHDLDWDNALTPGTDAYAKLLKAMDRAAPYLQQLEDAGVPVLWRPFHELDGGWFWWSKGGSEHFVKLWQLMYDRYTVYWGLDNLIWLLGYSGNGGGMSAWYPGDGYVDLIGADSYTAGANGQLYREVESIAPAGMPIMFHECGSIPTEAQMKDANAPWGMFMVWHTDFVTNGQSNTPASFKEIYEGEWFITLDELPSFLNSISE